MTQAKCRSASQNLIPDGPTHAFTTEALAAARAEVKARRRAAKPLARAKPLAHDDTDNAAPIATMMQMMQERYLTRAAAVSPRGSTCTDSAASSPRSSCSSSSSSTIHSSPGVINGAFTGELPLLTIPKPATDVEGHPVYDLTATTRSSSRGSSSGAQQPRSKPKWQEPKSAMLNKQLKAARESKKPLSLEERKKARRRLCETQQRPAARVYG